MNPITFSVTPRATDQAITINLTELLLQFRTVPDLRKPRGVRYPLSVLLTIAVLAKLCGDSQIHALADWAHARASELAAVFGLPRPRMPHPTTWTRVFGNAVAAAAIETAIEPLLNARSKPEIPARASRQIALDGKSLRGTIPAESKTGVHLVSAYRVDTGVPCLQVAVPSKANELVVAPSILRQLDLQGVLVTGDAMFAQRALSRQIVEAGGDYCWIVKQNQPSLYDDLRLLFGPQPDALPGSSALPDDFVTVRSVDLGHGRLDERTLTSSSLLAEYQGWPYLAQAFQLIRISQRPHRRSREVRYGITSAPATIVSARRLLASVRGHWQIENGLHYRRDVSLDEDASLARVGQAPQVLATLNNLVCGLTAQAGLGNLVALQRAMAAAVDRWLFTH